MSEKIEITCKSSEADGCATFILTFVVGVLAAVGGWFALSEFVALKKDVAAIKEQLNQKAEK